MPKVRKLGTSHKEEELTKLLKKGLIDKGWTVKHLAELCGKDADNMSTIINHPMRVRFETIMTIANKLGIESIPT